MKRFPVILFLLISLASFCQDLKYTSVSNTASKHTAAHSQNSILLSRTVSGIENVFYAGSALIGISVNQTRKSTDQINNAKGVKFNMDYRILPLFSGKLSVLKDKLFPNVEPFFSVFLNRNTMYSNPGLVNANLSGPFNLCVSFGAGLRLPISQKILFDIGLRNEVGIVSHRQLHFTENFSKDSGTLGLTLGLSYKI